MQSYFTLVRMTRENFSSYLLIIGRYGENFTSDGPRKYFKKVKNAQEAHEAIRPTNIRRLPCK